MKNRQLKRLNLVLHNGKIKTIDCIAPGQVILLEDRKTEESFGGWVDLDEIEFIPLTEEWVLKLGFKNKTIYIKGICLYLVNEGMSGGFQDNEYGINEYVDIKYVHQLQNLYFALTGEELTLNN